MRLIDADALIAEVEERICKECEKRKGIKNGKLKTIYQIGDAPCRACAVDDMQGYLEDAPTIDPVKHGKWNCDKDGLVWCCLCGFGKERSEDRPYNFCPNCGARMEGEDNDK